MLTGTLPSSIADFNAKLAGRLPISNRITQAGPLTFVIEPLQHPVIITFYLLCPNRKHLTSLPNMADKRIIHLDEDLWKIKGDLIINRLTALLGYGKKIYARHTVAARISMKMGLEFQQEHHLHVALPGKYRYGLFLDGELVSVAIFSGGRRMHDKPPEYRSFELLRFCHRNDVLVPGGFTKLMQAFVRQFHPGDVMTYIDKEWSDGAAYRRVGFVPMGSTEPQRFWIHRDTFLRYSETRLPQEIQQTDDDEKLMQGLCPLQNLGSLKMVFTPS